MTEVDPLDLPLASVRVLDLSRDLAGPFCAQILADLGADVIKVEHPGHPDEMRKWPPLFHELSTYFIVANRNKRCLTLDLSQPRGQEIVAELAKRSQIVVENFRLGVAEKLGVDYTRLSTVNPALVACSIRGYGPGPREHQPAYDAAIQAYSGIMGITGAPDGEVARVGVAIADLSTALYAANACQAALRRAERTGKGSHVEVSLLGAGVAMMSYQLVTYLLTGTVIRRSGTTHPALSPVKAFHTATEDLLVIGGHEGHWRRFCQVLGHPEWGDDPRFDTNIKRVERRAEINGVVESVLTTQPIEHWLKLLSEAGVPHAPVRTVAEVADDATIREHQVRAVVGPDGASMSLVGSPMRFDGTTLPLRQGPPAHGAHTDEILRELGCQPDRIAELRSAGVV